MEPNVLEDLKKAMTDLKEKVAAGTADRAQLEKFIEECITKRVDKLSAPVTTPAVSPTGPTRKTFASAKALSEWDNIRRGLNGNPIVQVTPAGKTWAIKDQDVFEAQKAHDDVLLVHHILKIAGPKDYQDRCRTPNGEVEAKKSLAIYGRFEESVQVLKSTMAAGTSGAGLEWVPTDFSSQLTAAIQLEHRVAALFNMIQMPTDPYKLPTVTNKPMASIVAEGAAPASTSLGAGKPTTANRSLTTKIYKYFLDFTDEVTEDSIVPMIDMIRGWLVQAMVRAEERAIINGDTSGTHLDTDITDAEDPAKNFVGLRKHGSAVMYDTGNPSPFTSAAVRATRALLSISMKADPANLAYIVSPLAMLNFMEIAELITIDKFGPQASIMTGQVGMIDGSPVILSEHVREDLAATGVYAAASTFTIFLCVHRPSFVRGERRAPRLEMDKQNIKTGVTTMVASMRRAFLDVQDQATFDSVAIGRNLK